MDIPEVRRLTNNSFGSSHGRLMFPSVFAANLDIHREDQTGDRSGRCVCAITPSLTRPFWESPPRRSQPNETVGDCMLESLFGHVGAVGQVSEFAIPSEGYGLPQIWANLESWVMAAKSNPSKQLKSIKTTGVGHGDHVAFRLFWTVCKILRWLHVKKRRRRGIYLFVSSHPLHVDQ